MLQILFLSIILITIAEAFKGLGIKSIKNIITFTFVFGLMINYIFYGISIKTTIEVVLSIVITLLAFYFFKKK